MQSLSLLLVVLLHLLPCFHEGVKKKKLQGTWNKNPHGWVRSRKTPRGHWPEFRIRLEALKLFDMRVQNSRMKPWSQPFKSFSFLFSYSSSAKSESRGLEHFIIGPNLLIYYCPDALKTSGLLFLNNNWEMVSGQWETLPALTLHSGYCHVHMFPSKCH